ncbi:MAG TPA: hypothetical protein DEG17_15000 [Cyanobacteria bacterium UBA11149]|nr:hypothetical protein [Cyanobacteria bacterium UBA11367]HBK65813.1 hypothetical protein [Cyanobacteria bacterium UBA11166]HBR76690.1 hypothetical protein [Cyanobacteria bacterium UBA11159]HBS72227.1 hypothetical protein [Cyanobacteria bacterium UBA11153]HBW90142.1 hypothetical protein [Cyanobacteria bacterium UBA11149]HCA94341.1 hypothetical protein [Cyanobacteria bacterium UBA9226]
MLLINILLLGISIWAAWIGIKYCEQVYGIALVFTSLILAIWSLVLAPLWFQISVECLLIIFVNFSANVYLKNMWRNRRSRI